ncbi:MAG: hypothetical protein LBC96_03495 [Lachnospiraceae bacterium]|nr:hypothetical protein [Lachnospiraceae bacterium]
MIHSTPDRLRYGANVAVLRRQSQLRRDYTPPKCRRSQHSAYEYIKPLVRCCHCEAVLYAEAIHLFETVFTARPLVLSGL